MPQNENLNEQHLCPVCRKPVKEGENICSTCGFSLLGATQSFQPIADDMLVNEVSVSTKASKPTLIIKSAPYDGETFELTGSNEFTIGRDPNCDIFLNNRTVSRHHATIYISDVGAQIKDEDSMNGTWINSHPIDTSKLNVSDVISIGTFNMLFCYSD